MCHSWSNQHLQLGSTSYTLAPSRVSRFTEGIWAHKESSVCVCTWAPGKRSYMKCSQLRRIRESYSYVNRPGHGSANLQTSKWKRASRPFLPRRQVPIGSSIKEAASSGVEVATHPFEAHVLSPTSGVYILVTAPRLVCYPQRHDFSMSLRPAWAIASIMQAASRNFIANSELVKCSVSIPRCRSRFWASTGSHYSSGTAQLAFSGIITRCISNVMRDCYPQPSRDLTDT